ncbi:MAG TPA: cbb3-type cytochrome c oxidase subunit II [Lacunisphaera sp.]|nr:cbb3-type cytochrome c oxidase subunit II [Lacunisphaera sp.]
MKNGLILFLGVFATMVLSWAGVVLAANKQIGTLPQFKDPVDESLNPQPYSGVANQGRAVYQDLGCATCHTQQIRYGDDGADIKRGWGERASYVRDYLRDETTHIGQSRLGPDLRNLAKRLPSGAEAEYLYKLLYAPDSKLGGEPLARGMPAYRFLFEERAITGNQPSYKAIKLPSSHAAPAGFEIVPTPRAEALVAYLRSLADTYDYPTERGLNAPAEVPKEGGKEAPKEGGKEAPKGGGH